MISLRKAIHVDLEESLKSAVESYRAALGTVADVGARAYPPAGESLKQELLKLQQHLAGTATPGLFADAERCLDHELKTWGDSASRYYQDSAEEIKSLLLLVAKAAAEVGDRDHRYGERFQELAGRLQGAAKLDNISAMRQSLSSSAVELVDCVTKMTEDGHRTVEQLRAQVSAYEARMEEVERLASTDPLTGVCNRRVLERQLERRVRETAPFCVIYFDLNGFKQINDTLGHQAGDDLLKQFAAELSHSLRSTDMVGRLGGDEFVALVAGPAEQVRDRIDQVKRRVNGDYSLPTETGRRKVPVAAAVGLAAWKPGMAARDLLRAADADMYEDKKRAKIKNAL
ncbi:MAG: GGDEF domain-containing protein [Acidobacteriia bacterium]|nr:GGDEF domain-containing protein [Terriglobia bacterium]